MNTTISVRETIQEAIALGLKNVASVGGAVALWVLTCWIPYINIGTTIALIGLVPMMSRGEVVSPMEIFDAKYRRNMGEFYLAMGFVLMGVSAGTIFGFGIGGIVISIAWGQAIFLVIDKELDPIEAMKLSNKLTYGNKFKIFLAPFAVNFVTFIGLMIVNYIAFQIWGVLGFLTMIASIVAYLSIQIATSAVIYGKLTANLEIIDIQVDQEGKVMA